ASTRRTRRSRTSSSRRSRSGSIQTSSRVGGSVLRCGARRTMPQYVIEREVPGAGQLSEAQIREISIKSLEVLDAMGPKIQWLHSYVTDDKIYCVYLAPDEAAIREHA